MVIRKDLLSVMQLAWQMAQGKTASLAPELWVSW